MLAVVLSSICVKTIIIHLPTSCITLLMLLSFEFFLASFQLIHGKQSTSITPKSDLFLRLWVESKLIMIMIGIYTALYPKVQSAYTFWGTLPDCFWMKQRFVSRSRFCCLLSHIFCQFKSCTHGKIMSCIDFSKIIFATSRVSKARKGPTIMDLPSPDPLSFTVN